MMAAAGFTAAVAVGWRWRISGLEQADLTASMHWPEPIAHDEVNHDRGPVLVTIKYDVRPEEVGRFLDAIRSLGFHRRRDGAFAWGVYEDTERRNHFIESFYVETWLEPLRQHERVTHADRLLLQQEIDGLLGAGSKPCVAHYVAPVASGEWKRPRKSQSAPVWRTAGSACHCRLPSNSSSAHRPSWQ